MSLIKDIKEQNGTRKRELVNPKNWQRAIKWRHQRAERGYSDRDTWNGGDYILEVTSGVLKKLGDEKSHIDWDEYFNNNYKTYGYKSLEEVAADIDSFLEYDDVSWAIALDFKLKSKSIKRDDGLYEYVNDNTPDENRRIRLAIKKYHEEYDRRYRKMKNAMIFVALNAPGLWD